MLSPETTTVETTRIRLIAALDALKSQFNAAGMMHAKGLAEIERGRAKLSEAQALMADHMPEVHVVFRAAQWLRCDVHTLDDESMVSAVVHGRLAHVGDLS